MQHEKYIKRALELAKLGLGSVSPNPMVGAVIVHDGLIIGEGYHQKYGEAHAEVNAVNQVLANFSNAEELLQKATIYVTLEPCAHFGKTPPCADLIIKHKIPNVVIGCLDPFGSVNGKGVERLKQAGIIVTVGVLERECLELNQRFFTKVQKQRPYIILKWAQTQDGFFSPTDGTQRWISNDFAKQLVHQWRSEEDCVLVGKRTALADNPQLNVRLVDGRNPLRAVVDKNLELPASHHLFDKSIKTFVFNQKKTAIEGNTYYVEIEDFDHFLPQYILYQLYLQDVQSLIIEGGAKTLQTFIDVNLWDEARVFTASEFWGEGIKAPLIKGKTVESTTIGSNQLHIIKPLK
ncbi:bifunctional diaminohydroxyphosphoribosylaminopyrimidine deaminase/5-amino-6-(5-phosphoribosylamino)uracil reductase RibD [Pedobacter arcticus]|uniref:bifunctional diaminohydroxyphosphoribosylaminopyrimidine deaminase/5-amino-6-(5-phosphoribosylamino)uracil reductase RibD n=1 Tax=Pedobacter arcticus TaxID=752140 RepID=UPI0002D96D72|nr:bifunctional diaminohydroxyphosphoribosylaminopyrimidine deaminase/5-amino-6-(5-phosphoribosylamino)uracil reductase RibD [Pedobacter arcticus]